VTGHGRAASAAQPDAPGQAREAGGRQGAAPGTEPDAPAQAPGPGSLDRAANVFGALALVVADQAADAVAEAAGRSASAAAALSALANFLERPSVDLLRQVLGLTSSGTVRLLDRLAESGYIERGPGPDGRSTTVRLTEQGRLAAQRVSQARAAVLQTALGVLTPAEREAFDLLAGKVLVGRMRGPGAVRWICRLCDIGVCRGGPGGCPVGNAARARYPAASERRAG
jgi:DNA-binding MarR family transcriptional regulator